MQILQRSFLLTIAVAVILAFGPATAADWAVTAITSPDTLITETPFQPQARIANHGAVPDSFGVFFNIERAGGGFYEQFTSTTFPPTGWHSFDNDGGTFTWRRGTTHVHTPPAYATCLREASLLANDDWLITPKVKVNAKDTVYFWFRALGPQMESIRVRVSYTDSNPASFTHWIQAYDFNNNTYQLGWADFHAVGDTSVYIGFQYKMRAGQAGTGICLDDIQLKTAYYSDTIRTALAPGDSALLSFGYWTPKLGRFVARCSVYQATDTAPGNDQLTKSFKVWEPPPPPSPWDEVAPMPLMPSGKAVKRGGWLAPRPDDGLIYAAKGYKTGDFYAYNPAANTWTQLTRIGEGTRGPNECGKGGKGVVVGEQIYVTVGNNTRWFLRYDIPTGTWLDMEKVPEGWSRKNVKGGTDMVYVPGDTDYVYLLKGYKTEFYRYDVAANVWETLEDAPAGYKPKYKRGSWLVFDGDHTLYAHKARYQELFTFDLNTQTWSTSALPGMPLYGWNGKKKKSKDGSSAAYYEDKIYALKGGNTQQFWVYDVATATWTELDTLPSFGSTGRKKRVKYGGDICLDPTGVPGRFYALKGNKTRELWTITIETAYGPGSAGEPETAGRAVDIVGPAFTLSPNPTPVGGVLLECGRRLSARASVEVFDIGGRKVAGRSVEAGSSTARLDMNGVSPGVYLVRLTSGGQVVSRKLVLGH